MASEGLPRGAPLQSVNYQATLLVLLCCQTPALTELGRRGTIPLKAESIQVQAFNQLGPLGQCGFTYSAPMSGSKRAASSREN